MPETWIERDIQRFFQPVASPLQLFPVWLLLGPRQVGKSSLLRHVALPERQFIDLDDLAVRQRAQEDPVLFSRGLRLPLAIDEIQYAPTLLSPIKQLADQKAPPGSIWLTGSQSFEIMAGVRETLAGRVAIMNLLGLSDHEKGRADRASVDSPRFISNPCLLPRFRVFTAFTMSQRVRSIYRAMCKLTSNVMSANSWGSKKDVSSKCS